MPKPADCTTMAEIRAEIDRLDEDLVRLFAERAGYIDRAAEIKATADLPARIESARRGSGGQCSPPCRHLRAAARTGGKAVATVDRLVHRARGKQAWT
jgi:hypothetical protein